MRAGVFPETQSKPLSPFDEAPRPGEEAAPFRVLLETRGLKIKGFKYFVRGAGKGRAGWCVIAHKLRREFLGACHHLRNRDSYRIGLARTVLDRSEQIHPA